MGKSLVLAEKPSVAKELASVLHCRQKGNGFFSGEKYIVTWALGHLVTLADPEHYGDQYKTWSLETLPMLPKKMELVVMKETRKQFKTVADLLRREDVGDVIIATDSGREGELVARWILMKAHCKKPAKRLWISSQTEKAIRQGFAALKPAKEYDNLFYSAVARAEADWLVGLNITRALTCKFGAQLSAGRVQTPTLALVIRREEEIRHFQPQSYYTLTAKLPGLSALWRDHKGNSRLFDEARADALLKKVQGKPATVIKLQKQMKSKMPPAAYDLTELQRDANKKYAYSAKQTLSLMQSLYERHKALTYPRTDSRYIPQDVAGSLSERLQACAVGKYTVLSDAIRRKKPIQTKYIVNDKKVTDHHAIIPTEQRVNLMALSPEEKNIYDLVVRRFLAVLSEPFQYEETTVTVDIGGEQFHAKGKTVKSEGWKAAYETVLDDEDDDSLREQVLPALRQGQKLAVKGISKDTGKTKPPARYTEATLLTAMENPLRQEEDQKLREVLQQRGGLGTSATRADIIEKLFAAFYMERQGKDLVPTSKGNQVISLVPADLKSAELTAKWEQRLQEISEGKEKNERFIGEMREYATRLVSDVIRSDAKYVHDNVTRQKCPECGQFLLEVQGKRGKMLVCPDRECGYRHSLTVLTNARCPNCHKKLEMRGEGEKKMFVCVCGHRERLSDFEKRKEKAGANKNEVRRYLNNQPEGNTGNSALMEQLKKWQEQNK